MNKGAPKTHHKHQVITVGSGMIDHYVQSHAFEVKHDAHSATGFDSCFPLGAKLTMDDFITQTGGGATNAAVTLANLGFDTATICRVGDDLYGRVVKDDLSSHKIHTHYVQVDKKLRTGQSIILLADVGYRTIFSYRGASAAISRTDIPWKSLEPKWFYITSLGGDLGLMSLILDRAEACGASVFWNPGSSELKKGLAKLKPLLERVDILDMNREEAAELTEQSPRHLKSILKQIGYLPKTALLLSDGPKGAYLHTRCCTWYAPPLPGKLINTTGAGDALGSGFLAGFMKTCDLAVALQTGMLNALGVITQMGAKTGILKDWPSQAVTKRVMIKPANIRE